MQTQPEIDSYVTIDGPALSLAVYALWRAVNNPEAVCLDPGASRDLRRAYDALSAVLNDTDALIFKGTED